MGALKKPTSSQRQTEKVMEYLRGVISELKKVHWPNRRQLLAYTGVVFLAVIIVTVLLWVVDSGLSLALSKIVP
jgi:preprotein translocase subunit SecE